jgi:hypothetical protein
VQGASLVDAAQQADARRCGGASVHPARVSTDHRALRDRLRSNGITLCDRALSGT